MRWVRSFLLLVLASILTDILAWLQFTIPLAAYTIPIWIIIRVGITGISLCWILRVRCWVSPSTRQKIQDFGRDEAYNQIYDIAQRASRH